MACQYADYATLILHFPSVVVKMGGVWRIEVVNAVPGDYTIEVNESPFTVTAEIGETPKDVRDKLIPALAGQMDVSVASFGISKITLNENEPSGVESISVLGPNDGDIVLEVKQPQDNSAYLEELLESVKCGVNCCLIAECDQALYHAALAAHFFQRFWGMTPGGANAADWDLMKLGPATIRQQSMASNENDSWLSKTDPGQMVLMLRDRYIPKVVCA